MDKNVEVFDQTKLLGTVMKNNLQWEENTSFLVQKANKRMQLLPKNAQPLQMILKN